MSQYQKEAAGTQAASAAATGGRRLRVGVVGLGIGRMHIDGWLQHPQVDVVAIADTDAQRLAQVGEQFGIAHRYAGFEAMLDAQPLDVVSICTPNKFHKDLTLRALAAGCLSPAAMALSTVLMAVLTRLALARLRAVRTTVWRMRFSADL